MGETTAVAHGGNPHMKALPPLFRSCIAFIFPTPYPPHPTPCLVFSLVVTPCAMGITFSRGVAICVALPQASSL
ncbi:hypothetical protein [Moorena sp. SIO4G3]|uniref:hypothetical protein n=1 Tax=Moorena sp. SIO4G3 TaxID=2607821 RepID=UPI00142A94B1|nr:hypothetical protein [Moorena sp. SIO4G3]NEO76738.1 hypothetical protein [Moorena sp. SIO4G3]